MKVNKHLGLLFLGIWLLLTGLMPLLRLSFPASGIVMALLAVIAGVLLILDR